MGEKRKEELYIKRRKLQAFLHSMQFYLCRIFPVKKNRIAVCTFEGRGGFGCNPKYIIEELHRQDKGLEIVWLVNDMSKEFPDYIRKVPNTNWSRAYWLSTSKVWIDNYRTRYGTRKRKGQYYLNTWHGMVGFKTIGLWRGKNFSHMAYLVSESDSKLVDHFLSDSFFTDEYYPKGLVYQGELLRIGAPRCDIFINEREKYKKRFFEKYRIDENVNCVMYAPTFREKSKDGKRSVNSYEMNIDFEQLLRNLECRFGGKWILFLRMHPQVSKNVKKPNTVDFIDLSDEDDMNSCMVAMDALITDYSSCAMDAELLHIPVFIFASDADDYKNNRGDFVWDIREDTRDDIKLNRSIFRDLSAILPFTIAHNNAELEQDILSFDEFLYSNKLMEYEEKIGMIADGLASKNAAGVIINRISCG